jgi:hypothetical protein
VSREERVLKTILSFEVLRQYFDSSLLPPADGVSWRHSEQLIPLPEFSSISQKEPDVSEDKKTSKSPKPQSSPSGRPIPLAQSSPTSHKESDISEDKKASKSPKPQSSPSNRPIS